MSDFLKNPIYLEFMNEESKEFLSKAREAVDASNYDNAIYYAGEAKIRFSPSDFYINNEHLFIEIEEKASKIKG